MKRGSLVYTPAYDRWTFESPAFTYDLHCGDVLDLRVGGHYISCRLELGPRGWYVVIPDPKLRSRTTFLLSSGTRYIARLP
ncbi:hypothetical protein GCM10010885_24510 [Alicyclobacillus cellulosilyticus]|uniref:DUF5348 domain-containing protein n=1 Tax=Alicyclobacillus cellulosilyticus TaxID=1003997 RepID=A0A917KHX2_9BACL|nr:hypothetical protein GCM10010885_24510 [Alicyclobacillus cellulosilyticus]